MLCSGTRTSFPLLEEEMVLNMVLIFRTNVFQVCIACDKHPLLFLFFDLFVLSSVASMFPGLGKCPTSQVRKRKGFSAPRLS